MRSDPNVCPSCGARKKRASKTCAACYQGRGGGRGKGFKAATGYRLRTIGGGKKIGEHRWVMQQALGRDLLPTEHVHHKNGVRDDNRLENLEIVSPNDHQRLHTRHDWDEISRLYHEGLSTTQIGELLGFDPSIAGYIIGRLGISRSLSEAASARPRDAGGRFISRVAA